MHKRNIIRKPICSGLFYPAEKEELKKKLSTWLTGTKGTSPALILPHCSYHIMGEACSRAWIQSAGRKIDRILLLGPVHREPERGLFFPESESFLSPLGEVFLDRQILKKLASETNLIRENQTPHEEEHGLELSLPFISTLFPEAKIIPLLSGINRKKDLKESAQALAKVLGSGTNNLLTIITSNSSSYTLEDRAKQEALDFNIWLENTEEITEKKRAALTACGASLIDLFNMTGIGKGSFKQKEQFHVKRNEGGKSKAVYYGTYIMESNKPTDE